MHVMITGSNRFPYGVLRFLLYICMLTMNYLLCGMRSSKDARLRDAAVLPSVTFLQFSSAIAS